MKTSVPSLSTSAACLLVFASHGLAAPQVRRAEVAAPPLAATSAVAAGGFGAREQGVLGRLRQMTPGQITELLQAYARMGNRRMTTALGAELTRRDPTDSTSRKLAAALLNDASSLPDDPAAREAAQYQATGQPAQAARVYTNLKKSRYPDKVFPWQEDLAYAWYEAGLTDAAKAAFEEILRVPGYAEPMRNEARKAIRMIMTDGLSRAGFAALGRKEGEAAHRLADQLLAANPGDRDAVSLKAGAWTAAGQPRRAVEYLLSLKRPGESRYPHQLALGAAYQDSRMFDDARAAYQVVLNDPNSPPEERHEAQEYLKDLDRESRLIAGDHALRTGQLSRAEIVLTELEQLAPGHAETVAFKASVQLKRREYVPARQTLEKLRDQSKAGGRFFESRDSLAEALAATGAPKAAAAEYMAVRDDTRYDRLSRYEAASRTADFRSRFQPGLGQEIEATHEAEGSAVQAINELSTGEVAGSPNVFLLRTAWDTVELDQSRLLQMKDSERYQVEAVWRRHMQQGFFGEVSAGGSGRGAVYGITAGRFAQPGATSWQVGFRGNDRASDSLPLIALDGRQNEVAFSIQKDPIDRLSLGATVRYRWIDVRGRNLGEGVNVNLNATYTLLTETLTRPELTLGYLGDMQNFAGKNFGQDFGDRMVRAIFRGQGSGQALSENLIEERINRHGLILTLSKKFSPRFSGYVYGGMAREFAFGDNEGLGGAGMEAFIGPRASVFLNVDYNTSGRAGSRGSEVWTATTGARVTF